MVVVFLFFFVGVFGFRHRVVNANPIEFAFLRFIVFNSITLHDILRQTPFHTCRLVDREIVRSPDHAHACAMTVFSWRILYGLIDLQTKFKISRIQQVATSCLVSAWCGSLMFAVFC